MYPIVKYIIYIRVPIITGRTSAGTRYADKSMTDKGRDGQCAVYDFTVAADNVGLSDMHSNLRALCKAYVFQLERGEQKSEEHPDGYLHYQGRLSLYKKMQLIPAANLLRAKGRNFHLTHSSKESLKGPSFYCMKEFTRVSGPWTENDYKERPPMTRRLQKIFDQGLYPWQKQLKALVEPYDDRNIHLVIDTSGNNGKSSFTEYMEYEDLAYEIPPQRLMEDIMSTAMSIPPQKCYMIDMPRAMKKEKLSDFYSGIESLKNGVMYDKRYRFKKRRIECPQIIVFTNSQPNLEYLSRDRWRIHTIDSLNQGWHEEVIHEPIQEGEEEGQVQQEEGQERPQLCDQSEEDHPAERRAQV